MHALSDHQVTADDLRELSQAVRVLGQQNPEIVAVYLFGSVARSNQGRDVDLGVVVKSCQDMLAKTNVWRCFLEGRMGSAFPAIDLRLVAHASAPRFRFTMVREGKLLYEANPVDRIRFETQAIMEWFDFEPYWNRMKNGLIRRWIHGPSQT